MLERLAEIKGRAMTAARVGVAALALTQAAARPETAHAETPVGFATGEAKTVGPGCVLSGDFFANGVKKHDDSDRTAALLKVLGRSSVFAPYGGSGICGSEAEMAAFENSWRVRVQAEGKTPMVEAVSVTAGGEVRTINIDPGVPQRVEKDCLLRGDVNVEEKVSPLGRNGGSMYDDDEGTVLIVKFNDPDGRWVSTKWGASGICSNSEATRGEFQRKWEAEAILEGRNPMLKFITAFPYYPE